MSKRPSQPSAYHRKYRKLRKEVERLLCSDDTEAFATEFKSDGDEQGESSHCDRHNFDRNGTGGRDCACTSEA